MKFFTHKKNIFICLIFSSLHAHAQNYCNDFENGASGWSAASNTASIWELDTVINGIPGNHVWGMDISGNYIPLTTSFLYTPVFDFSAAINPSLCFSLKYETETYQDGMRVEYSFDSLSWNVLGSFGMGPDWYNSPFITSGGTLPGWSGMIPTWQNASISLNIVSGMPVVWFRFVFTSDGSIGGYGFLIDNFCICDPISCNCAIPTGVPAAFDKNKLFSIYPNPANNQLTILSGNNSALGSIRLSDLAGKEILNQNISENKILLDVKNISNGAYFISIEKDGNLLRRKIMVLH